MTASALLALLRIPNVFTAVANVVAGVVLARRGGFEAVDLLLCGASASLYLAGMVLNDYCDRAVDARERPERPIPSGQIAPRVALALGAALLALGVALAAAHSAAALAVALPLAACVVAYDAALKDTALGPLAMGACRFLNVTLGLVATAARPEWAWLAAEWIAAHTIAITILSRDEVAGGDPERTRRGVGIALGATLGAGAALVLVGPVATAADLARVAPFYAFVVWRALRLFRPLLDDASPAALRRAIGGGILLMPAIDAVVVAAAGHLVPAALIAALALPAYHLRRRFSPT